MATNNKSFYLSRWIQSLEALSIFLSEKLGAESSFAMRARLLAQENAKAIQEYDDITYNELLDCVFLPRLDKLLFSVREALYAEKQLKKVGFFLTQARENKRIILTAPEALPPPVANFTPGAPLRRDPKNRHLVEDAIAKLKAFLAEE